MTSAEQHREGAQQCQEHPGHGQEQVPRGVHGRCHLYIEILICPHTDTVNKEKQKQLQICSPPFMKY